MLPPGDHEEACKLFCTWLHRSEERKEKHGQNLQDRRTPRGQEGTNPIMEDRATDTPTMSNLSKGINKGADKKRFC